MDKLSTYCAIF